MHRLALCVYIRKFFPFVVYNIIATSSRLNVYLTVTLVKKWVINFLPGKGVLK